MHTYIYVTGYHGRYILIKRITRISTYCSDGGTLFDFPVLWRRRCSLYSTADVVQSKAAGIGDVKATYTKDASYTKQPHQQTHRPPLQFS